MERDQDLIPAALCCTQYLIEYTFLQSLQDAGLVDMVVVDQEEYLPADQLRHLERYIRLHHELDINIEGVEAIAHLLHRVEALQKELTRLSIRLRHYEEE